MAALLNKPAATTPILSTNGGFRNNKFMDPRANILYGAGNKGISGDEIRNYISQPGRTDAEVEAAAYKYGVNLNQIADAMKGNKAYTQDNMESYLAKQGVSKDLAQQPTPSVGMPDKVGFKPISVGNNETVEGRMSGLLKDPNNPLNVQSQTFGLQQANKRGLLNSSIATSAAQDAMYKNAMPIAQQDAATFYDATKTNSMQDLSAQMFNSDMQGRIGMFNAGTQKDMAINRENNNLNRYVADLDAGNKIAIANIQAMSQDSSIMGDFGKSMMEFYYRTSSDPNLSPDVKKEMIANLTSQFNNLTSLLPSFQKVAGSLNFNQGGSGLSGTLNGSGSGSPFLGTPSTGSLGGSGSGGSGNSGASNYAGGKVNIFNYQVEPNTLASVNAYEKQTGTKIDRSRIVPDQLVRDLKQGYDFSDGDGARYMRFKNYIDSGVIKYDGNWANTLASLFVPVHPQGTMRADAPVFYIYR